MILKKKGLYTGKDISQKVKHKVKEIENTKKKIQSNEPHQPDFEN